MKKEVVGSMSEWAGVLKDFFRQIEDGSHTHVQVVAFNEHRNPFQEENLSDWQNFYHELFGIQVDFSNLQIPERKRGFDRLLVMAQGITPQRAYDKGKELFPCWKWTDKSLDEVIDFSKAERSAKEEAYAVWVRERVEADEELKNLSAEDIKERSVPGITLDERIVYELKYFRETGEHLDVRNVTLCSGSRYLDGCVPSCYWRGGEFSVRYDDPRLANPSLRARAVVSLPLPARHSPEAKPMAGG